MGGLITYRAWLVEGLQREIQELIQKHHWNAREKKEMQIPAEMQYSVSDQTVQRLAFLCLIYCDRWGQGRIFSLLVLKYAGQNNSNICAPHNG